MRLINTTTRRLETFLNDIPDYAILSHTWGAAEVNLADYVRAIEDTEFRTQLSTRDGYRKIDGACQQADRDNHHYIWIDTCCIDKRDETELSEAIRSMFSWYRKAITCYALIEGIDLDRYDATSLCIEDQDQFQGDMQSNNVSVRASFRAARWFRRGWTLQELLAPREVYFFAEEWIVMGRRSRSSRIISEATGIDRAMLENPSTRCLDDYSVAQIMSWAAQRETKRVEDLAYCLMGLFDIQMPLLYGEGLQAFERLQESIIRTTHDHTIFVWDHQDEEDQYLLLAPHPNRFKDGKRFFRSSGARRAYVLNNTGLSITLQITETALANFYWATLNVTTSARISNPGVQLVLQKTSDQYDTYFICPPWEQRWRLHSHESFNSPDLAPALKTVVISKSRPLTQDLPQQCLELQVDHRLEGSIASSWPEGALNPARRHAVLIDLAEDPEHPYMTYTIDLRPHNFKSAAVEIKIGPEAAAQLRLPDRCNALVVFCICNWMCKLEPSLNGTSVQSLMQLCIVSSKSSELDLEAKLLASSGATHKVLVTRPNWTTFRISLVAREQIKLKQVAKVAGKLLKFAFAMWEERHSDELDEMGVKRMNYFGNYKT